LVQSGTHAFFTVARAHHDGPLKIDYRLPAGMTKPLQIKGLHALARMLRLLR